MNYSNVTLTAVNTVIFWLGSVFISGFILIGRGYRLAIAVLREKIADIIILNHTRVEKRLLHGYRYDITVSGFSDQMPLQDGSAYLGRKYEWQ